VSKDGLRLSHRENMVGQIAVDLGLGFEWMKICASSDAWNPSHFEVRVQYLND
jgi:hypothetical protein